MTYISKGWEVKGSKEKRVIVLYCGGRYELNGEMASVWRRGRRHFARIYSNKEEEILRALCLQGLVETTPRTSRRDRYLLLTNCLLCIPQKASKIPILNPLDRKILLWLKRAAFRLSVAELVYLTEMKIHPIKSLLGESNRMTLSRRIHSSAMTSGKYLEQKMSVAVSRDLVVESIVRLVRKRKLYLI